MVKANPSVIKKQLLKLSALILLSLCSVSVNGQQLLEQTILMDTLKREYLLYIPADYDGSEAWPLVLNMHGAGNTKEEQLFISQMNQVADTAHFLIAYPEAALGPGPLGDLAPVWNVGLNPNRPNDVAFLDQLIQTVGQNWNLDLSRVYTTGMSQGGSMSYMLSCNLSSRIAAMASVSGSPGLATNWMCTPNRPVPLMHIHGTADLITPINGGPGVLGPIPAFPPARTLLDGWINSNNCTVDSTTTELPDLTMMDSSTVTLTQFQNCDTYTSADGVERTTEIWFYQIDNGGHTWPDGPTEQVPPQFAQFFGHINRDINASAEIWNFFNRHVHPNPASIPQLLDLTLQHQDSTRKYLLYIPADYDGTESWPMVINMHGQGNNRHEQMFISQMNQVADTGRFLVVYPEGTLAQQPTGAIAPSWNPAMLPGRPDDIDFIDQLIDTLEQNWNVDETRIYATGLSQGGVMSYLLACNIPDRLAAIASVSGVSILNIDWTCTANRPMPVLHMHGTSDLISPIDGGVGVLGPNLVFPSVRDQLEHWLNSNECTSDSTMVLLPDLNLTDGSTVELRQYQSCTTYTGVDDVERVADLWYYLIEDGGHTWPNGPVEAIPPGLVQIFGNINRDINASSEIWNFFNRHIRPKEDPSIVNHLNASEIGLKVFPNPFTTKLAFEFELAQTAKVQLSLFNTLGQPVARLTDQLMATGKHRLDWQTQDLDLSPGLYYFHLRVDNRSISQAIVVGNTP